VPGRPGRRRRALVAGRPDAGGRSPVRYSRWHRIAGASHGSGSLNTFPAPKSWTSQPASGPACLPGRRPKRGTSRCPRSPLPATGSSTSAARPGGIRVLDPHDGSRRPPTASRLPGREHLSTRDPGACVSPGLWRPTGTASSSQPTQGSAGWSTAAQDACLGLGEILCPWLQGPTRSHGCARSAAASATSAELGPRRKAAGVCQRSPPRPLERRVAAAEPGARGAGRWNR
jgi:hypothetical protein